MFHGYSYNHISKFVDSYPEGHQQLLPSLYLSSTVQILHVSYHFSQSFKDLVVSDESIYSKVRTRCQRLFYLIRRFFDILINMFIGLNISILMITNFIRNTKMTHLANGGIVNGSNLGANSDFVTIYTVIGHATGDFGVSASDAQNAVKLFEMIGTKANVKYTKISSAVVDLSVSGNRTIYGLGTNFNQASTTVYTIKFMAEQAGYVTAANLAALIQGVTVPNTTAAVPSSAGNADQSAYETASASLKNIVISVADLW
jgi:hypothetical protein